MFRPLRPGLRRVLVAFAFCCGYYQGYSQSNLHGASTVIPPSPTAASLGKYGNIPVSYYTGQPAISIPLYHTSVAGVPFDLALSYHASGIKVQEDASWVGLGWSLEAGGVITRTMHGLPDERGTFGYSAFSQTNTSNASVAATSGNPKGMGDLVENNRFVQSGQFEGDQATYELVKDFADGRRDGEPDDFYFNFCGKSGRIFFDAQGNPYSSPYNFWRITGSPQLGFVIIDEQGIRYEFKTSETTSYSYGDGQIAGSYASSWYLTTVTFPNQELLTFTYESGYEQSVKYGADSDTQLLCSTGNPQEQPLDKYTVPDIVNSIVVLTGIKSQNFAVEFNSGDRADDPNLVRLNTITIRDDTNPGTPLTTWSLSYAYDGGGVLQTGDGLAGLQSERLQLHTLTRTGEPAYQFEYYAPPALTGFASVLYRQDHWGFANNNTKLTDLPATTLAYTCSGNLIGLYLDGADKSPSFPHALAYTLRRVVYPTGGYTTYEYEPNDYGLDSEGKPVADTLFTAPQRVAVSMNSVNPPPTRLHTTASFTLDHPQPITFQWSASATGSDFYGEYYSEVLNGDGSGAVDFSHQLLPTYSVSSPSISTSTSGTKLIAYGQDQRKMPVGTYTVNAVGIYNYNPNYPSNQTQPSTGSVGLNFTYTSIVHTKAGGDSIRHLRQTGGLRIRTIRSYDGRSPRAVLYKRFEYLLPGDGRQSSGIQTAPEPVYGHTYSSRVMDSGSLAVYYARSSCPASHLGSTQGGIVGYRYVTVYTDSTFSGVGGKEEFVFTTPITGSGNSRFAHFPFAPVQRDTYKEGLLLRHRTYRSDDAAKYRLLTDERTNYQVRTAGDYHRIYGVKVAYATLANASATSGSPSLFVNASAYRFVQFATTNYEVSSGWVTKQVTTLTRFGGSGDSLVTATDFTYDARNGLAARAVQHLPDRDEIATTQYASDYDSTQVAEPAARALRQLQRQHRLSVPVEHLAWTRRATDSTLVGGQVLRYRTATSGQVQPAQELHWRSAAPVAAATFAPATLKAGTFSVDTRYAPQVLFDRYDSHSNLLQAHAVGGAPTAYLWGYGATQPIAQAQAARYEQLASTSFEPMATGRWHYDSTGTHRVAGGRTGHWAYQLDGRNSAVSREQLPAGNYELTYWVQGIQVPAVTVGGGTQLGTGPRLLADGPDNWHQYRTRLCVMTTGSVSLDKPGTGPVILLDELRLYPVDARLTSYTYDPLVGMTSQTDPTGRLTTYEYDALGRLVRTRDEQGRILSQQQYHYAGGK